MVEPTAVVSAVKTSIDVVKGLLDLNDRTKLKKGLADVLEQLIRTQQQVSAVLDLNDQLTTANRELRERLEQTERWTETASRYMLKEPVKGRFVYELKESARGAEPIHWCCTNCWADQKRSILLALDHQEDHLHYRCPSCGSEIEHVAPGPSAVIRRRHSSDELGF
jgi:regulator of replication initiation timing/DNA-directed RNA polymerase subunit RPC12/RpoP